MGYMHSKCCDCNKNCSDCLLYQKAVADAEREYTQYKEYIDSLEQGGRTCQTILVTEAIRNGKQI